MVVSFSFVNGFHHWPVLKWFPPCLISAPLFTWLGFVPLGSLDWRPWTGSSIVVFFYCPSCTRPCHTSYDILLRHRSTLYVCGYDRLLSMDPPCSFMAMTALDLICRIFSYWVTMIVSSVIHMLDLPVSLWRWFVYGHVCTRDQFSNIYLSYRYLHSSLSILDSLLSLHTHLFPL